LATLGIDLGGTNARAAVVDADGRILAAARAALQDRTPEAVTTTIAQAVRDALALAKVEVRGCGIGVAGQLLGDTGVVAVAPNLGWRNVPFGQMLASALGHPVRVVNDLTAAAWGELIAGAGRGAQDVYVVYVGSGVGSAIICRGEIVRGGSGVAGELGHIKVEPGGRRCGCGEQGCLEAYAGGRNLILQMREALESGQKTSLQELSGGDPARLNPAILERAALAGDMVARRIYDRATEYLALAVANQVTVLNPSRLILGGGVLNNAPAMRDRVRDGVARFSSRTSAAAVRVVQSELGDDSGIIGAALLATRGLPVPGPEATTP